MKLTDIYNDPKIKPSHWMFWEKGSYQTSLIKPKQAMANRETLAHLYLDCVKERADPQANPFLRYLWTQVVDPKPPLGIPRIIGEDGFLRMYAMGSPLKVGLFRRIWERLQEKEELIKLLLPSPLRVECQELSHPFYDVDASPPGFAPKFFTRSRLKKDEELLQHIASDLKLIANIEKNEERKWLTLAILSHGAVYRELDRLVIEIPSFHEKGKWISYSCAQHFIAEGIKTVSLRPLQEGASGIYLCQGTELWPSQPSVLGSILANFAIHGSATAAYAHSWRRIHQHLRELQGKEGKLPLVAGHSMGGSLAIQIGLYSHNLIENIYAFNPPMPNERDHEFYHHLSAAIKDKILIHVNLDDFAFWRIGAKVVGKVTLFLGKSRWRYFPITYKDYLLLFVALGKFIVNVRRAFPAHQHIIALYENWVSVELTEAEIAKENQERTARFDYLHFFPRLYRPLNRLVRWIRRWFGWSFEQEYLRNEVEIIALHERDLMDTLTVENKEEIEKELRELRRQKEKVIAALNKL